MRKGYQLVPRRKASATRYVFVHRKFAGQTKIFLNFVGLAPVGGAAYPFNAVNQPLINVEEKIDRFVGRRTKTPDSLQAGMQLQATAGQLHRSLKHRWWPKGVYRFKTHEEADAWMTKMLAQSSLPKT